MLERIIAIFVLFLYAKSAFAGHPLISDDAGTQGKGNFQLEINAEFTNDTETESGVTAKKRDNETAAILSYGLADNVDIISGLPYQWKRAREDGAVTTDVEGIADLPAELKWRFYEKNGLNFVFKPGITFPTGNENKGLGNGGAAYSFMFITTKEIIPWAFHLNLGYAYNEYRLQGHRDANRKAVWHVSVASEVGMAGYLKLVANLGVERNPDRTSNTHPAFILGGIIYSISEGFDIDFGIKSGLNKSETDLAILAGSSLRF